MKGITNKINTGLATALLLMLLTFGGMSLTRNATTSGLALTSSAAQTITQQADPADTTLSPGSGGLDTQTTAATTAPLTILDARYAVQQAGPAVVTVINTMQVTTTRGRFGNVMPGQSQVAEASGSGVIIDSRGYIVTNQHVVANQQSLQVIFADGTKVAATLVGEDVSTDLALLKVDVKVPAVAQFGDSDKLELGQPVVAIGTALGDFVNTVTEGIVSGTHRHLDDASASVQDLIQTDAAINHGNSGGPLLDLEGKVIGINTAVVRNDGTMGSVAEGLGFAIPSNTVSTVVDQLLKNRSISR
jgi:2-alkenal reductase